MGDPVYLRGLEETVRIQEEMASLVEQLGGRGVLGASLYHQGIGSVSELLEKQAAELRAQVQLAAGSVGLGI